MKVPFIMALLALALTSQAQFTEQFSDGDLLQHPVWEGNTANWTVNPAFELQSNHTVSNSSYFISTANTLATNAEWSFYCRLAFNPSGVNYTDVFLSASASDLAQPTTTGYFVRLGNTDDEISLYRKDAGSITKIIDGANGTLNSSNNQVKVKVTRDASNQWSLYRDLSGTGNNYVSEGDVNDATYVSAAYFGILIRQSTSGFFQKHFFDDIDVKVYVPDIIPPEIQGITATGTNTLDILFNEPVSASTSQSPANYSVSNNVGFPVSAERDPLNSALVHLVFANAFPVRVNITVSINAVTDIRGNAMIPVTLPFHYVIAMPYDVVISELMPDPTPVNALPDAEWLELRNTSAFSINLEGFRIGKSTGESGPFPAYELKPDSFLVVCATGSVASLSAYGPAISLSGFPSLNNNGDLLYLRSKQGTVIHSVNYNIAWYQDALKEGGGWSLEMTDCHNPCTGKGNWKASVDASGGTPGRKNSTEAENIDDVSPRLQHAFATDSLHIMLQFDEPVDSSSASVASRYQFSDGIPVPDTAIALSPYFNRVMLVLPAAGALLRNKVYTVTATGITDCTGNHTGADNQARVGLYENPSASDIVVNEILFNPRPNGNDYVELYNRGRKILNLEQLYIANRNTYGDVSNIRPLSADVRLLFPGDFLLVTESIPLVMNNYISTNTGAFIEVPDMPSFNDDKGDVVMLNNQGDIVDEVSYSDDWHFSLVSDPEGISLERIDYDGPSQDGQNWHSAATTAGYGTPGYKNSQLLQAGKTDGEITITPEIVSPDNDAVDDFATISYAFPSPAYVCSITVFDASGRPVRSLQQNALCGQTGYFRWDGLGNRGEQLASGIYIIYTSAFNLEGKTRKYKNVIVLARKQG